MLDTTTRAVMTGILALAATVAVAATVATAWPRVRSYRASRGTSVPEDEELFKKLPQDLLSWRAPGGSLEEGIAMWESLRTTFLRKAGIDLWHHDHVMCQKANKDHVLLSSGFTYATPPRMEKWIFWFRVFNQYNALTWMGTTREGHNVAIRIMSVRDEGKEQLQILRRIARGDLSLCTENHVAPLWDEVEIGYFRFAITPFIGHKMSYCYGAWAKNSVGDIVDMIIQALEALKFLHQEGIAHRDAEKDNFMVQWHPESLAAMQVPTCRPRVFIIDFETAHEFPLDTPEEERRLTGPPWDDYLRELAPEIPLGPYDPFKVDVWQLAHSLSDFKSSVAEIDAVLETLRVGDPACRPTAAEARDQLAAVVHGFPPVSLLIPPVVLNTEYSCDD